MPDRPRPRRRDAAQVPPTEPEQKSVADLVFDVSERTSTLIREEIELAKAEVSEKVAQARHAAPSSGSPPASSPSSP